MTPTIALLALPPPTHLSRSTALKPVAAGSAGARTDTGPDVDAEGLREEELRRLDADPTDGQPTETEPKSDRFRSAGSTEKAGHSRLRETPFFPGTLATFLAQLYSQGLSGDRVQDPFGDAARAYDRLRKDEEQVVGLTSYTRHPVDFAA